MKKALQECGSITGEGLYVGKALGVPHGKKWHEKRNNGVGCHLAPHLRGVHVL